jgi:formyl-CoA transferase
MRVLDMTQYEAGPACTQALAWLGADVVKIERPGGGDPGRGLLIGGDHSAYFVYWNSNKRSVALDLEKPAGKALLLRMLPRYDVFVENFGPGVLEKLGLDYEAMRAVHPGLIYARIKGFGSDGPYAQYKCFDMVAQAASGA